MTDQEINTLLEDLDLYGNPDGRSRFSALQWLVREAAEAIRELQDRVAAGQQALDATIEQYERELRQ